MSSGPVEQLRPTTSTSSALERRQHRLDVGAEQHLAAVAAAARRRPGSGPSRPTRLNASRAPKIAALHLEDVLRRLDDDQVGAALDEAAAPARSKTSTSSRKVMSPSVGSSRRAGSRSARSSRRRSGLAGRLAGDLGRPAVDLDACARRAPTRRASAASPGRCRSRRTSAPASSIDVWTPSITSGRLRTSASWHLPGSPP